MNILVVCPLAVGPAWEKQLLLSRTATLWRHQSIASAWGSERLNRGEPCLWGMDMGTGKTLTAIDAIGCQMCVPVLLLRGSTASKAKRLTAAIKQNGGSTAAICNYDAVWRPELAAAINAVEWDAIILDESHRIKSPTGRASRWLSQLARHKPKAKRCCLTGTPMPHSPLDLFGQFHFMEPSVFGNSFVKFRARYAQSHFRFPSKIEKWLRQDELAAISDEYIWRVAADDVLDLPEALHEVIPVTLSPRTMKYCRDIEDQMTAEIESGTVTVANALGSLLRQQQGTGGYAKIDDGAMATQIDGTPDKAVALEDMLEDLPAEEPVVVFCRFRADLEEVAAVGRRLKRTSSELSGRMNQLAEWQNGETTILAVQIQAGGVGIDLVRAAYCVYYSLGFSLGEYEQSLARLRRPGQTRCIRYYHLIAADTVDEQVYSALRERRNVVDAVLDRLTERRQTA